MKVFGWIQSKLKYGRHDETNHKPDLKSYEKWPEPEKEEVNDWLHGLLAIGTFGKNDITKDLSQNISHHLFDPVSDEIQDDSCSLWNEQCHHTSANSVSEIEQQTSRSENAQLGALKIVPSRGKDTLIDNNKQNDIGKKSLSFLLKKLVCRSGFTTLPPSPKASIPELRTEMIFRAMLHRKIYPQTSNHSLAAKKCLENRKMDFYKSNVDGMIEKATKGSKWVKTDSEYIVLEM